MKEAKARSIAIILQPPTIDLIDEAAKAKGQNRSDFIRNSLVAAARGVLRRDPPAVALIIRGRRPDAITPAAAGQGLTREEFFRKIAREHLENGDKP
jgi:uncharacterized protein (DUF1778 family)